MTANIIPFPLRLTSFNKMIAVENQRESFATRVIEQVRRERGKTIYDYTKQVYCPHADRVIRVPVVSTEGNYQD